MQETTQTAHSLGALVEALIVANVFVRADDYDGHMLNTRQFVSIDRNTMQDSIMCVGQ